MPQVACACCSKVISRSNGRINENKKFGHNFYCSRKCLGNYLKKRIVVSCVNCNKSFEKLTKTISEYNYCSRSCAVTVNNHRNPKRKAIIRVCKYCSSEFKDNKSYCSVQCYDKDRIKYSREELLQLLKSKAIKLGRTPAKREVAEISWRCINIFGSWNKAIQIAGLTPNRSDDHRMYKRVITKARDGHLCDSVSEAIIDNWLTENNISHKRDADYPSTNHKADWGLNNGTYVEYFGLAKDSPRYDRDVKIKQELCKKHGIKLIEIYPEDLYPMQHLKSKLNPSVL